MLETMTLQYPGTGLVELSSYKRAGSLRVCILDDALREVILRNDDVCESQMKHFMAFYR